MRVVVLATFAAFALAPLSGPDTRAPSLRELSVSSVGVAYAGDSPRHATISPNGDGYRDSALIHFRLDERATVRLVILSVGYRARTVFSRRFVLGSGTHRIAWRPRAWLQPRTYLVRVTVRDRRGNVRRYGFGRPGEAPVIRVLGIEPVFTRESYAPRSHARLVVETDRTSLTLQIFRSGYERVRTHVNDAMNGEPMTDAVPLVRADRRERARTLRVWIGDWPSGLYFAKLTGPDRRAGYAPFVVRPRRLGEHRVAVVLPTYTWQAYNFRDANSDGYGDTWYAGQGSRTLLGRPFLDRGVPPFFRAYDLNFLQWLAYGARTGEDRAADFLTDSDLGRVRDGVELARSYDLLVFPGHHEYVTRREYASVRTFRDRGGNLMFLSANNFFWRVDRRGRVLTRVRTWRDLGRPEAALLGVQYVANDRGGRKAPFVVRGASSAEWLLEGTGLGRGSSFGLFGIEIDRKTRASPPGTIVLAEIPNLLGRGKTAQMTYYETAKSAKVFAAGAFTLAGYAKYPPVSRLLDNLWERLARP